MHKQFNADIRRQMHGQDEIFRISLSSAWELKGTETVSVGGLD